MTELLELPQLCPLADIKVNLVMGPAQNKRLAQAVAYLRREPGPLGVDTETTGLDPHQNRVRLIQVGTEEMALVVDLDGFRGAGGARQVPDFLEGAEGPLAELAELLRGGRPKVLQNAAFDLNFLRGEGVLLGGPIFDTMFASKVFNMGTGAPNNLGAIVERTLGEAMPKELQKANWAGELDGDMVDYAARDACALPRLVDPLRSKLKGARVSGAASLYDVFKLEMQCLRAFASMQWWGFGFDAPAARELKVRLVATEGEQKLAFLEQLDVAIRAEHPEDETKWLPREPDGSFNTREETKGSIRLGTKVYAGFNPRSPKQMAQRFADAGVLLPPGEKGLPSLDQNLLAFIKGEEPLVEAYLGWKEAATRVSGVGTLLESQGADGRIHAGYRQMGTDTGRVSCASPNLQQIPRIADFRSLFVAAPGYSLVVADFSQVELRVAAELSGETRMIAAYKAGRDLHTETAMLMAGVSADKVTKLQRQSAKACFSGDTEVLTPDGWVELRDYAGQKVAQYMLPAGAQLNTKISKPGPGYSAGAPAAWDGNCGEIQFVDVLHYDSFHSDDVWGASDRNFDVVATGNHEILYIDAYGNAIKKLLSKVREPRNFVAAGYLRREEGLGRTLSRVLAMVVADGSFKQTLGWVSLGFSKRRKIHRCRVLLEEAGIEYKRAVYSNGENGPTTFFKFRLEEAPWLIEYVNVDKQLQTAACLLDVDALAYLTEAQYWDGSVNTGTTRYRVSVTTVVKESADTMQAMAVTAGLPCTVYTTPVPHCTQGVLYRVSYAFRTVPTWRPSWEPTKAEAQQVFCVQVPSSLILIRRNGKVCVQGNCNFGLLYGAGAATLQKQAIAQYGLALTFTEAQEKVQAFRKAYPTLLQWQRDTGEQTCAAVYTRYGRRRMLTGFNDKYTTRLNTPVQGTAGDICKIAIGMLWKRIKARSSEVRLLAQVHDELVLEVLDERVEHWSGVLKADMEAAGNLVCRLVPIIAEVSSGKTWADAK